MAVLDKRTSSFGIVVNCNKAIVKEAVIQCMEETNGDVQKASVVFKQKEAEYQESILSKNAERVAKGHSDTDLNAMWAKIEKRQKTGLKISNHLLLCQGKVDDLKSQLEAHVQETARLNKEAALAQQVAHASRISSMPIL